MMLPTRWSAAIAILRRREQREAEERRVLLAAGVRCVHARDEAAARGTLTAPDEAPTMRRRTADSAACSDSSSRPLPSP